MFGNWRERGRTPIGIDFGARAVRAVQLALAGDQWRVTSAASASLPSDVPVASNEHAKATATALVKVLETGGFSGKRVVSALPSFALQNKNLRVPQMPPDELRAAVEWEASDRLKLGQNFQVQFFDAGEVRQGEDLREEIILFAASTPFVEQHVNLLSSCGLTPVAIDVDAGALARCAAVINGKKKDDEVRLILDLGTNGSNVLIARHDRIMFFKRIDIGSRHLEDALAQQFNLAAAEAHHLLASRAMGEEASDAALAGLTRRDSARQAVVDAVRPVLTDLSREVGLCLRYQGVTFRGQRASVGLLTGGLPDPLLPQVLAQETGLTVEPLDTHKNIDWSAIDESMLALTPAPLWAVAMGLAFRQEARSQIRGAA